MQVIPRADLTDKELLGRSAEGCRCSVTIKAHGWLMCCSQGKGFAVRRDDAALDRENKAKSRWGDPMAGRTKKKAAEPSVPGVSAVRAWQGSGRDEWAGGVWRPTGMLGFLTL